MTKTNYAQLYKKVTKGLSPKVKDIFDRRFGVKNSKPETLESIGDDLGITRERVRQIEEAGFTYVRKNYKETLDKAFSELQSYFDARGGFKKEDVALLDLGGKKNQAFVLFLLTLGDQFSRVCEKKDYYYFWSTLPDAKNKVKDGLATLVSFMDKSKVPMTKKELSAVLATELNLDLGSIDSYIEVSKNIKSTKDGKLGLISWPEIKPRGVKDKSFLVFKKHGKPLHFTEVARMIDKLDYNPTDKKTYAQTVHNELIKDARFVLVGRGTYALAEWGYTPGTIKDLIMKVLQGKSQATHKDEIVKEVLSQRLVAKNTVLMNLNNKKHFEKDEYGNYFIRKTETA